MQSSLRHPADRPSSKKEGRFGKAAPELPVTEMQSNNQSVDSSERIRLSAPDARASLLVRTVGSGGAQQASARGSSSLARSPLMTADHISLSDPLSTSPPPPSRRSMRRSARVSSAKATQKLLHKDSEGDEVDLASGPGPSSTTAAEGTCVFPPTT
jgi:hypothetical protein